LGVSVHNLKENAEILVAAVKQIGLELNADKTCYKVMTRDRNAVQSVIITVDNISLEMVEETKYLVENFTDLNYIQARIKSGLMSGMICKILCRIFCLPMCTLKF
jgi:hypothetical protein